MGDFIYFTEEQKERANAVQIADILRREHEEVERSGNEWRWKRHRSVTFRGSMRRWSVPGMNGAGNGTGV